MVTDAGNLKMDEKSVPFLDYSNSLKNRRYIYMYVSKYIN